MNKNNALALLVGASVFVPLSLKAEDITTLPPLAVHASRMPADSAETGSAFQRFSREDLEAFGNLPLIDFLSQTPGIHFAGSGPRGSLGTLNVRGAPQRYLLIRVNGVDVSDPSVTQIAPQVENLRLGSVSSIDILRGSQSSLFGGQAVAGVIEINTLPPEPGTQSVRITLEAGSRDTFSALTEVEAAGERGSVSGHLEFFNTNGFSAADENDGNTERDGYRNANAGVQGTYAIADELVWRGSARFADSRIEFDGFEFGVGPVDDDGSERTYTETAQAATGLNWTVLDGQQVHDVQLSYFRNDRDTRGQFPATFLGERWAADYVGRHGFSPEVGLLFGLNAMHESAETDSIDENNQIYGLFLQLDYKPTDALYLSFTGRVDEHSEFGNEQTWKTSAAYQMMESARVRTSVGTGFRAPSLFELFDSAFGNPDLDPETSLSWDAGVDLTFRDGRDQLSVTYFSLEIDDKIDFVFPAGYTQVDGKSERQGLELSYRSQVTDPLLLIASYTYMIKAEDRNGNPLLRVPEHDLSLAAHYRVNDWTLSARAAYVAGVEDVSFALEGPPSAELDSYWVVDTRIAYQVSEALEVYVRIENLFDEQYQQTRGYGTPDRSAFAGLRLQL
jgi:vitamin B12 transporter